MKTAMQEMLLNIEAPKEKAISLVDSFMWDKSVLKLNAVDGRRAGLIAVRDTIWPYLSMLPADVQEYWKEIIREIAAMPATTAATPVVDTEIDIMSKNIFDL